LPAMGADANGCAHDWPCANPDGRGSVRRAGSRQSLGM